MTTRESSLSRRADFDRVFQHGRHNSARLMAVRSVANQLARTRWAFAISKRVGNAVVRNKIKRRLRESLRLLPVSVGYDIVIVVRQPAAEANFQALRAELEKLLKRAHVLAGPA